MYMVGDVLWMEEGDLEGWEFLHREKYTGLVRFPNDEYPRTYKEGFWIIENVYADGSTVILSNKCS